MKRIYLDHAATTPVDPKVLEKMLPYFTEKFGNPSSVYMQAQESRKALDEARAQVAEVLNCNQNEVIFTSGGTESDNTALKSVAFSAKNGGNHIITTEIEHHAIIETCHFLKKFGFHITYLPVDRHGMVSIDDLDRAITDHTVLVSVMYANNEVGTVQPIARIGELIRDRNKTLKRKILFHTDSVQAAGALDLDMRKLGVDMASFSAHKFYGPKGVGILYVKRGTDFMPQQTGGAQERNRRAGTENVPGIVGCAEALARAAEQREANNRRCQELRDRLIKGVLDTIPRTHLNGHPTERLPNNANFSFEFIEGESILLNLDFAGIAASSGSACASESMDPSHVLTAMKVPTPVARGSVRFTAGAENTVEEIDYVLSILPPIIEKLRAMSPIAEKKQA